MWVWFLIALVVLGFVFRRKIAAILLVLLAAVLIVTNKHFDIEYD